MGLRGDGPILSEWGAAVMERLSNLEGKISPCACGKQPKHLHRLGKDTHALDCPPCGARTSFYPTLQEAVQEWETARAKSQEIA